MPTFSAIAYPATAYTTYTQTYGSEFYVDSQYVNLMDSPYALNNPSNNWQWWNYTGLHTVENNTNQCAKIYMDHTLSWPNVHIPGDTDKERGRLNWWLDFDLEGWEDLPEYIVVKGITCEVTYQTGIPYSAYRQNGLTVKLKKPDNTTSQKDIQRPAAAGAFEAMTVGASNSTWFATVSASDLSGMHAMIHPPAALGPQTGGGAHWIYVDQLKFVLYFQTDWYYGVVGTAKGTQSKMNGIELATVAGVSGMSREA